MPRIALPAAVLIVLAAATATTARAQATPASAAPMTRPANDSLFRHARRLVLDGNGVAGRALVDSMLAAAAPGSSAYGDALYWHGALASTLAAAERDYRRVIVEYPLAFYADDALLAIAELEQGRGDHAGALAHLQRFVKEHPASPARGIAALGAARLAFDQHDNKVACAMITEARASVSASDVELNNQIAYYTSRCPVTAPPTLAKIGSVPTRAATPVDTQTTATRSGVARVEPDSMPKTPVEVAASAQHAAVVAAPVVVARPVTPAPRPVETPVAAPAPKQVMAPAPPPASTPTSASHGRFTVQIAAFETRAEAETYAAAMARRGLATRVTGSAKPFRVRLGFHPTYGAAAAEMAGLKARGIAGWVTEEVPAPRAGKVPTP